MSPRPKKYAKPIAASMKASYKPRRDHHSFGEPAKTIIQKRAKPRKKP